MTAENKLRLRYVIADFVSSNIAVLIFNVFRYYELPDMVEVFWTLKSFLLSPTLIIGQIFYPVMLLFIYYLSGIYNSVYLRSRTQELITTATTALAGTLILFFAVLINDLTLDRTRDYTLFFALFGLLFVLVYVPRLMLTLSTQRKLRSGEIFFPTLIVGYSSVPQLFSRQIERIHPSLGSLVVGLVDSEDRARYSVTATDLPIFDLASLPAVCKEKQIKRMIVIPHPKGWSKTLDVVNRLFELDIPTFIAAEDLPAYMFNAQINNLRAEPYIDITRSSLLANTLNIKRSFDVAISAIMLVLSAIPLAFVAVAIKIDSSGPVFYRQRRVGLHKREFEIIKLRTMYVGSEAAGEPVLSHKGDRRITPLGRFLRKYRIDEIPQFYNVLKGDMSIVGPRPERPFYLKQIIERVPAYTLVFRVRPGITSLGMVRYGYASTLEEIIQRSKFDMLYLENISMATDMKIILNTASTVFGGKGI